MRAAVYSVAGRGFGIAVRVASLMVLGRLLSPRDYGLVTMVTAFTGILNMFGALGLFQAAIQRDSLSEEESVEPVLDERGVRRIAHAVDHRRRARD